MTATLERAPSTQMRRVPAARDRYIDSLRAVALARVVTYHVFGWAWLPIVFPSMGIMFALAGSLVAASLDRSPGNPWRVLVKRGRRLLPPLWLMGAILVPVMLWHGWRYTETAGVPLHWKTLLLWVFPISDPPGSAWGEDWVVPLWYLRAYLWFLLLSPAFLWLFRRWPKRVLAVPLVMLMLATFGVITLSGRSGDVILSMSTFGACWLLGFAHHDGSLRRVPLRRVLPAGVLLLAAGLGWAFTHPDPQSGWDIDNIPLADGLFGLGAVLILLRCYPDFSWVSRRPVLDKLVTVANSRAMTIYLWNNVAIFLSTPLVDSWSVTAAWDTDSVHGRVQQYLVSWLLVGAAIVAFGWVEDLLVGEHLDVGEPAVIVDRDVHVVIAHPARADSAVPVVGHVLRAAPAMSPPTAARPDLAQLLDVGVHQLTGTAPLVAGGPSPFAGGPVQLGQPVQTQPHQHPVHPGRADRDALPAQFMGDPGRAELALAAQPLDASLRLQRGPRWAARAAGPVDQAGLPVLPPPRVPLAQTLPRPAGLGRHMRLRATRIDSLTEPAAALHRQRGISVRHEDLQGGRGCRRQLHTSGGPP